MCSLSVAIFDDEAIAIRRLSRLLRDCPGVSIVGTAANAEEAERVVQERNPDLILLDIEMPGLSGIAFAGQLTVSQNAPAIIFVTAYSRFALEAFDLAATDYLLKPVEPRRLADAIERVRTQVTARQSSERVAELEELVRKLRVYEQSQSHIANEAMWIPTGTGQEQVPVRDIIWIGADRDYVRIHTAKRTYFMRARLGELARRLVGHGLIRVHRSAIVRTAAIRRIEPDGDRCHRLTLNDGTILPASRRLGQAVRRSRALSADS